MSNFHDPAVNEHIRNQIRCARKLRSITMAQLGKKIGISFQQIQKYENGDNRVSAEALFNIAAALNVPLAHFFPAAPDRITANEAALDDLIRAHVYQGTLLKRLRGDTP